MTQEILIKSLMSVNVACLPADAALQQAINQMADHHHSCTIIMQSDMPVGIITERDLVKAMSQQVQIMDLPVTNLMTAPIVSINENLSLFDAMVVIRAQKVRHLPVLNDEDQLVGLVTQSDLANAHFRVIELQAEVIKHSVAEKTGELQVLNNQLQALSMEDHLMKIGNRRAMEVDLDHTHNATKRYTHPYSILLIDIDFFKLYNDNYGHQEGDHALQAVADNLKANIRGADRLYRYGGEELLVVLPYTNAAQAQRVAQKLVAAIARLAIPHEKSPHAVLTICCGGGCALKNGEAVSDWQQLVEEVDSNLYEAKNNGRNCSVVTS